MKEKITILLFCLIGMTSLSAQSRWGVMGGLNYSTLVNSSYKWRPGAYIGGLYDAYINQSWSVQPRLYASYEQFNKGTEPNGFTYKQWNLTLPILASLKLNPSSPTQVSLHAGPYVQFAMAGKLPDAAAHAWGDVLDVGHQFSYGIYTGASVEKGHWMVNFDFKYSLRRSGFTWPEKHEASLLLGVGYKF